MIATAAYTGPGRGELRGMYWENYSDDEMMIARSIWNGITTDPKSRKSKAAIPIIRQLAAGRAREIDAQVRAQFSPSEVAWLARIPARTSD